MKSLEEFIKDRNEALLSLDKEKILEFGKKHGVIFPFNDHTFWLVIHKSITGCVDLPIEFRMDRRQYLIKNGSASFDDGDLKESNPPPKG